MENYDLIMLAVLGAATLFGIYKGFAWQVTSLASIVVSYWVAYHFRGSVAPLVGSAAPWNTFTAMLVLYSASSTVIWLLFQMMAGGIDKLRLKEVDRQLGAVLGFTKGVLFCMIVTFFAVTLLGESSRQTIVRSKSGLRIAQLLDQADTIMPAEVKTVLDPYLRDFDRQFDPDRESPEMAQDDARPPADRRRAGASSDEPSATRTAVRQTWDRVEKGMAESFEKTVEDGWREGLERGQQRLEEAFRGTSPETPPPPSPRR